MCTQINSLYPNQLKKVCTGINTAVGVVKKCTFPFLIQTVQHVPCLTKNGRKMDRPFRGFSYPIHSIRFRSVPFQNLRTSFTPHTHTPLVSLLVLTRWSPFLSLYTQFIGDQANSRCHYPLEHPLWHVPLHLYSTPDHSRRLCWLSPAESSTFVCMHGRPYVPIKTSNSRAPDAIGE